MRTNQILEVVVTLPLSFATAGYKKYTFKECCKWGIKCLNTSILHREICNIFFCIENNELKMGL